MINAIQYPGRERCSEITVEAWHGPFFDATADTASHHKFGAILKRLDEGRQLPEIIGQVSVAHDNPLSADISDRIDVGSTQPPLRRAQNFSSMFQDDVRSIVARAVDDQDLPGRAGPGQAFLTPVNEFTYSNLFI